MMRLAIISGCAASTSATLCCFASWGDDCKDYPSGSIGGLCTKDWSTSCILDSDCGSPPPPTPVPPAPTPVPPAPTPPLSRVVLVGLYNYGYYNDGDESTWGESIYSYELTTGTSSPLRLLSKANAGPLASWITPAGSQSGSNVNLFSLSTSGNSVASLDLDCSGKVAVTSKQDSGGAGPVFLTVDKTGDYLLCANYGAGNVAVLPISPAKQVSPVKQVVEFGQQAHAHSAVFAPGSESLFVPTLGLDSVQQLKFHEGALTKNGAPLTVPKSQGPRHIAFHPSLPIAVLVNEGSADAECTVVLCSFDSQSGRISAVATYDTLPSSYDVSGMYPAEVLFSPDGAFVLVSNRDATEQKRDGISVFHVAGQSLSFGHYTAVGHYPRSMALADDGLLVVGNQKGNSLSVLQLDLASGALSRVADDVPIGASPAFVGIFDLADDCSKQTAVTLV